VRKGEFELCGQLDENDQLNGYGTLRRNGSIVYEGEFLDSRRNGYGLEYSDGKVAFEGQYCNDLREGWGRSN